MDTQATQKKLSRRALARIVSFAAAAMIVLGAGWYLSDRKQQHYQLELEYAYMRSIEDLSGYVEEVGKNLTKSMYTGTSDRLSDLSAQLYRDAGYAKSCLSQVPTSHVSLEKTYKFLSQVGDYAQSLAKKTAAGDTISEQERKNLKALNDYCNRLLEQLAVLKDEMYQGKLSFEEVTQDVQMVKRSVDTAQNFGSGLTDFEESLDGYPSLIYDGPFSDHILEREPEMTKNEAEISREQAKEKAAQAVGIKAEELENGNDGDGNLPCYVFASDQKTVAVTKRGGYLCYMVGERLVTEENVSTANALEKAQAYLDALHMQNLTRTYYEIAENILTVNYAHREGDVLCYTDLVKVSVALDNGEIVGFDAQGYITNHHHRNFEAPQLSATTAQEKLSPLLTVEKSQLALIPSAGLNELYCYEFKCKTEEGMEVLVYINTQTGAEEQILILLTSETGILTI